jgi:hypothetical protein
LAKPGGGKAAPNLADYLPNGKLNVNGRGVAGDTGVRREILSAGADVWANVSTRMQYFCKIGRLYDCK